MSGRLPITGDEPHYLIIAASVLRDRDFDVSNNYQADATTHEIYPARLAPHALRRETGWWPQHMPGLGVLLAIPLGLGGAIGARIALATLLIPVLGMTVYRWSRAHLRPTDAMFATVGVMACAPVIFGASEIYPDLTAGVTVLALVCWLWARNGERSALGWCVYWCAAGFLCWLHVKYYAPSAVLAGLGVWHLWRDSAPRFTPARYVTFGVLFLVGPALFCAFSISAFGNVLGGRGGGELNTDVSTAAEIFVGLHLDQVQGLFVQQPIFLPGLIALGWMIRRRHPLTVPWLVLYASLLVPNALQRMPYGGHVAPAGRFGWSAMWLWLIPLGIAAAGRGGRGAHTSAVRLIVLMGIAYQAALALQWVPEPQRLFNGLFPPQAWQPSLFPPDVMLSLPKFGLHGDIGYPPNVVWTFAAFSLIAAGFLHAPRLRYLLPAATVVFALLTLPVADTLGRSRAVPTKRHEAEHTRAYCSVHPRVGASNGQVCRQDYADRFAVAGPFISLDPGRYQIVAALYQNQRSGSLQVVAHRGRTFVARHDWQDISSASPSFVMFVFDTDQTLHDVEFRVRGRRGLEIDYIDIYPVTPADAIVGRRDAGPVFEAAYEHGHGLVS